MGIDGEYTARFIAKDGRVFPGDDFRYSHEQENMIRPVDVAELIDYILKQPRRTIFKNVVFVPTVEAW